MVGSGAEIYKTCRELAGLTQEEAAEKLCCSVRQLARYESGEQKVPDDIACRMVAIYDSRYLGIRHLCLVSRVAADLLPPVAVMDLPAAVLTLINRLTELADRNRRMMQIAEDNRIDEQEQADHQEIEAIVLQVISACFGFLSARTVGIKKERPEVAASRRSVQGLIKNPRTTAKLLYHNSRKMQAPSQGEGVTQP